MSAVLLRLHRKLRLSNRKGSSKDRLGYTLDEIKNAVTRQTMQVLNRCLIIVLLRCRVFHLINSSVQKYADYTDEGDRRGHEYL